MKADNVGVRMDFILEIVNMCVCVCVCGQWRETERGLRV